MVIFLVNCPLFYLLCTFRGRSHAPFGSFFDIDMDWPSTLQHTAVLQEEPDFFPTASGFWSITHIVISICIQQPVTKWVLKSKIIFWYRNRFFFNATRIEAMLTPKEEEKTFSQMFLQFIFIRAIWRLLLSAFYTQHCFMPRPKKNEVTWLLDKLYYKYNRIEKYARICTHLAV